MGEYWIAPPFQLPSVPTGVDCQQYSEYCKILNNDEDQKRCCLEATMVRNMESDGQAEMARTNFEKMQMQHSESQHHHATSHHDGGKTRFVSGAIISAATKACL